MTLTDHAYADIVVLSPAGRLDHESCDAFRAALEPHLHAAIEARRTLVLDLSSLEYVSSAGLRCFMVATQQAESRGGKIVVASPRPVVAEIFQISRFNLLFRIYPTLREALAALSPSAVAAFDGR
jgi:anti-sigma B factor antagonist